MMRKVIAALLALMLLAGTAFADYKELANGSRDRTGEWNVYSLQLKLEELGYLDSVADGIYGNGTADAVMQFQKDHGLKATGVADNATQELLFSIESAPGYADNPGATPAPTEEAPEEEAVTDVYIVQHNLFVWGFLTESPDGVYGNNTREAMKTFQRINYDDMIEYTNDKMIEKYSLHTPEPTPIPNLAVEASGFAMAEVDDVHISSIPKDGTITEEWIDYILNGYKPKTLSVREGDKNEDVQRMQNRLVALRYMAGGNDGVFGEHSKVALRYFQSLNGLDETGYLDDATAAVLFSGNAVESDQYVSMYKLMVSITDQRVYVYKWTGNAYTALVHTFICSTGTVENPTILGTFQAPGRNGEWYWMEDSNVWVKYAFVIEGGYFFHSVLYPTKEGGPTATSVRNLGTRASHGCIRLSAEDAEWIFNNCAAGTTVVIYDDAQ